MSSEPMPLEEMTYEQAFAELEAIVTRLENEEQSLQDSIALFERGQALAQYCNELLEQAELRVRQLSGDQIVGYEG